MPTAHELDRAATRRDKVIASIATSLEARGYPPSVRELADEHAVSTLTVRRDLDRLVREGKIERDPGVDRGIRLK